MRSKGVMALAAGKVAADKVEVGMAEVGSTAVGRMAAAAGGIGSYSGGGGGIECGLKSSDGISAVGLNLGTAILALCSTSAMIPRYLACSSAMVVAFEIRASCSPAVIPAAVSCCCSWAMSVLWLRLVALASLSWVETAAPAGERGGGARVVSVGRRAPAGERGGGARRRRAGEQASRREVRTCGMSEREEQGA